LSYPVDFQGRAENAAATDNPSMEAGLYTSLDDYAKILSIHLSGGSCGWGTGAAEVLSTAAIEAMRVDYVARYGQKAWLAIPGAESLEGYGMGWWIDRAHPGIFVDEGAWGAVPWLDTNRGYAAFIAIENNFANGNVARQRSRALRGWRSRCATRRPSASGRVSLFGTATTSSDVISIVSPEA
jgi:hypothetical protein